MAFGNRIRLFRKICGLRQKELGEKLGFKGKTSDVRIAQYESESRTPKPALVKELAAIFGVSPKAIMVPDIDSEISLMHTFFALEDMYGLTIAKNDGDICLHLDKNNPEYTSLFELFTTWHEQASRLQAGEITMDEYNDWRYNFPDKSPSAGFRSVPSKQFSDEMVASLSPDKD